MVEFGNLLNQYINIVDGAREGARFGSNDNPFEVLNGHSNYEDFFGKIYVVVQGEYDVNGVQLSKGAIDPIVLTKANGDDIVVTFFSVATDPATGTVSNPVAFVSGAGSRYNNQTTKFTAGQIKQLVNGNAPNTGILLVEVFYNYHQILKLGSFLRDSKGKGIMDPILVHAYSIMPLSAAEPTPTTPP